MTGSGNRTGIGRRALLLGMAALPVAGAPPQRRDKFSAESEMASCTPSSPV
jgi:hypothetical protein